MRKLNRSQLRRVILNEIRRLNEESDMDAAVTKSKENPKQKVLYYDKKDSILHTLLNGVIEKSTKIGPQDQKLKSAQNVYAKKIDKQFKFGVPEDFLKA
jgi:hypothetical protein